MTKLKSLRDAYYENCFTFIIKQSNKERHKKRIFSRHIHLFIVDGMKMSSHQRRNISSSDLIRFKYKKFLGCRVFVFSIVTSNTSHYNVYAFTLKNIWIFNGALVLIERSEKWHEDIFRQQRDHLNAIVVKDFFSRKTTNFITISIQINFLKLAFKNVIFIFG